MKISIIVNIFVSLLLLENSVQADYQKTSKKSEVKYRTNFGKCPSRTAGSLTLQLMKAFDRNQSLKDIKMKMVREKLDSKHFLSSYTINYNPLKKIVNFNFECPLPLMKVQIYKEDGIESYEAILVSNGKLYDPTYEVLLRSEKKLKKSLPYLAIPVGKMKKDTQLEMSNLVMKMDVEFRSKLSEIILSEDQNLTIILSLSGKPSSVFLGNKDWDDKLMKLRKIVRYVEQKKKIPAIINLTNSKKVVVKFNQ